MVFVSLLLPTTVLADWQQNVRVGLGVKEIYDSNVYNLGDNVKEGWTTEVTPSVSWQTSKEEDQFRLSYTPKFSYFHWRSEHSDEHKGDLLASKQLGQHFTTRVTGNYSYYDDAPGDMGNGSLSEKFSRAEATIQAEVADILFPELGGYTDADYLYVLANIDEGYGRASSSDQARVDILLTDTTNRRRHDKMSAGLEMDYEYHRNSKIGVGYSFDKLLKDDLSTFSPRDIHTPSITISHWFNESWQADLLLEVQDTEYKDTTPDEKRKNAILGLDYTISSLNSLSFDYSWRQVDYIGGRGDVTTLDGGMGWVHHFTPHLQSDFSVKGIYDDQEGAIADSRRVDGSIGLRQEIDRSTWAINGHAVYGEFKKQETWKRERQEYKIDIDYHRQLVQDVRGGLKGNWQEQQAWAQQNSAKSRVSSYEAGLDVSWSFWREWSLLLDYTFHEQTSGTLTNYHDHVASLRLSWGKDLWRF